MIDQPRVGFDALFLEQPMTGAGRYALNLWRQFRDRLPEDKLALLAMTDAPEFVTAEAERQLVAISSPPVRGRPRKLWWEQIGLPRAVRASRPALDLVHVPYFSAPALKSVPYVITIHDLIPLMVPEYHGSIAMRGYLQVVSRTARGAALVLTDSEFSRQDIERELRVPAERIRVIPLAADRQFSPAATDSDRAAIERVRQRYGLTRPYLLNTGGLDVRKQVAHVVEGFALARGGMREELDLVIVGRAHTDNPRMYPPLDRLIRRHGLQEHVSFVGAVNDDEFVALYRGAEFFVFASAYEGFGLTPLEAMACGTPVISSDRTSLAEVVGDAGLLIEPAPREIAAAIVRLASDAGLRAELAERGLERASAFSWERAADMTLAAYGAAARTPAGVL